MAPCFLFRTAGWSGPLEPSWRFGSGVASARARVASPRTAASSRRARSHVPGRGADSARRPLTGLLETAYEQLELCLAQLQVDGIAGRRVHAHPHPAVLGGDLADRTTSPALSVCRRWFRAETVGHSFSLSGLRSECFGTASPADSVTEHRHPRPCHPSTAILSPNGRACRVWTEMPSGSHS